MERLVRARGKSHGDNGCVPGGDVYIEFPYESATFQHEKAPGNVFRRFYAQAERETPTQFRSLPPRHVRRPAHHAGRLLSRLNPGAVLDGGIEWWQTLFPTRRIC